MAEVSETVAPSLPSSLPGGSDSTAATPTFVEEVSFLAPARLAKPSTKALLEKLDARRSENAEVAEDEGDEDDEPIEGDEPVEGAAAEKEAAPEEAKPDPVAEYRTANERLIAKNRELLAENEAFKKSSGKKELGAREKALVEAESLYLTKPNLALRRFLATAIGVDDPQSPEVSKELSGLYQDLTELELEVPASETARTNREAVRILHAMNRQKREAAEEAARAAAPAPASNVETEQATRLIATHLTTKDAAGKAPADAFPLLSTVAADIEGVSAEVLIFDEIGRAINAGELDAKSPNEQLIAAAAAKLESRYQALADKLGKARQPSTAAPSTQQASEKASPSTGVDRSHGVRSITNASASVAPATPPVKKPAAPAEKPKYASEDARRRAIIAKHLGVST